MEELHDQLREHSALAFHKDVKACSAVDAPAKLLEPPSLQSVWMDAWTSTKPIDQLISEINELILVLADQFPRASLGRIAASTGEQRVVEVLDVRVASIHDFQ